MNDPAFRDPDPRVLLVDAVGARINLPHVMQCTRDVGEFFLARVSSTPHAPLDRVAVIARLAAVLFRGELEEMRRRAGDPEVAAVGIHDDLDGYAFACMDMLFFGIRHLPSEENHEHH